MVPVFSGLKTAQGVTKTIYDMSGLLENARTYAVANNTYVFVGFAERDASVEPSLAQRAGVGRIFTAAIASKNGYAAMTTSMALVTPTERGRLLGW